MSTDADRFRWLAEQQFNAFHLERNADHSCNYVTAKKWIEEYANADEFAEVPADELQRMKDTNTIWRLQIYPDTPNGFYAWSGDTAKSVIDRAMAHFSSQVSP